ncbi:MAG TPA: hypothetical protein VLF20_01275, partial [Patescibacteria group bacterium]|nr:hypothetical protein [Patescibacteria group bacterium]
MNKILQSFYNYQKSTGGPSLEDISTYVKASTVQAQKGTKCVDGRYLPNQGHGMVARPGADCGYVMALEAVNRKKNLGLTPEQCFTAVFKAVTKLNGKFYFHTDEHVDPSPHMHQGLIGCGHLAKAGRKGFSWEYDVRSQDIKQIVHYARNLCEISENIEMTNLTGRHEEKGVLVIDSDKYTILADNPKRHQMYFIYDVKRDRWFMNRLVKEMNLKNVTYDDMVREADIQLEATLQNLAVGLPMYKVTFTGDRPQVAYIKHIDRKPFFMRMHFPFAAPQFFI